ncbi:MAG TPA: arginine deiminase-related protein [Alphaproteobacteria bacterium]
MAKQSSNHVLLIEPASFGYNLETADTNSYQLNARDTVDEIFHRALEEFRAFRNDLVTAGIGVTTVRGHKSSIDAIFPNWFTTHEDGSFSMYPMRAENRRRERRNDIVSFLRKFYALKEDLSAGEQINQALEGTGSMVLDRAGSVAYIARSRRTDEDLAKAWCARMGFDPVIFDTVDHDGRPVYHTSLMMWIGTQAAGIGSGLIVEGDRERVLRSLSKSHEVIEFENAQIRAFCGNAIEALTQDGEHVLIMSDGAKRALTSDQLARLKRYYTKIVATPIPTIETYGGASVGHMIQELF